MNDLTMMRAPSRWPLWPILPLKNPKRRDKQGSPEHGVLVEVDDAVRPTVYLANAYALMAGDVRLSTAPKTKYASFNALLADGWLVD